MDSVILLLVGMLIMVLVFPIVQTIADLFIAWGELVKSNISVKIIVNSVEIEKLKQSVEIENTNVIGFDLGEQVEVLDDDDDSDFPCEDKNKYKIGFCV